MNDSPDEVLAMIGRNVRRVRTQRGLTIVEAAREVGVSRVHFSNWERAVKPISVTSLVTIARLLRVPFLELLVPPAHEDAPDTTPDRDPGDEP